MRILYIEDNPANVFLVKRVAKAGKHEVINYIDGEEALRKLEAVNPDLILLDIQLAGQLTGLEVVKRIRSNGHETPVIAVTAYAMVGDKERCLEAGCSDYLAKPLPVPRLMELFKKYDPVEMAGAVVAVGKADAAKTASASAETPASSGPVTTTTAGSVSSKAQVAPENASSTASTSPDAETPKAGETPSAAQTNTQDTPTPAATSHTSQPATDMPSSEPETATDEPESSRTADSVVTSTDSEQETASNHTQSQTITTQPSTEKTEQKEAVASVAPTTAPNTEANITDTVGAEQPANDVDS